MTMDLGEFGNRERLLAAELLTAWAKNGWPDNFHLIDVKLCMDSAFGDVYLINEYDEYAALTDSGKLERYYFSPSCEYKGFFDDLKDEYESMNIEDADWFREIAEELGRLEEILGYETEEE